MLPQEFVSMRQKMLGHSRLASLGTGWSLEYRQGHGQREYFTWLHENNQPNDLL